MVLATLRSSLPPSALSFLSRLKRAGRSVLNWVGIRYNRAEAALFDLRHGTDTGGKTPAAELDIPAGIVAQITGYQSVNARHLRRVLETLPIPAGSTFVDVGCGKGKALLIAAEYPFIARAVGIELAGSLCRVAERNVARQVERCAAPKPVSVIEGDAVRADYSNGENVFFMNNPFDAALMRAFGDNVVRSARTAGRESWILYCNPVHHDELMSSGALEVVRKYRFFGPGRDLTAYRTRLPAR
jgi:SAM-dependent methyltransferase